MNAWPTRRLCELADIRVSNVDKKTHATEKPVKLCNYMDVYSNEYVTSRLEFMEGSASTAEIERFGLTYGDVVITKDSETPDDIGIAAVIAEAIDRLVCGYHLALIRPNLAQLDPVYLAKQLSTSRVARYFALHASGSTRYGLPISVIESVSIPTPPKPEQTKIAEILSTVDTAIEQTEALIAKQHRIKTGLMQDLLSRGVDDHGNLRTEQTHAFKDSPLGRIPLEWEVKAIGEVARVRSGTTPSRVNTNFWDEGTIPWVKTGEVNFCELLQTEERITDTALSKTSLHLEPVETVLVAMYGQGGTRGRCCLLGIEATTNQACAAILGSEDKVNQRYLYQCLVSQYSELRMIGHGSNQVNLSGRLLSVFKIKLPSVLEQEKVADSFRKIDSQLNVLRRQRGKLCSLKSALMQDLLTGDKRVTPLLEPEPAH